MLTVQFTVDQRIAKLTIPSSLTESEYLTVFVEAPGAATSTVSGEELFIQTDEGRAPFRSGVVLHAMRRKGRRLTFWVTTGAGEHLCSWQPPIYAVRDHFPGSGADYRTLDPYARRLFRRIGEPIEWDTYGVTVRETDEFRIDGALMTLLAIAPGYVILRDPAPSPGLRTIQGPGYDTVYRIVDARMSIREPQAKRSFLDITITGLEGIKHRVGMVLINRSQDKIRLLCGKYPSRYKEWNRGQDREEIKWVEFMPRDVQTGVYEYSCPITLIPGAQPVIDASLVEHDPKPVIRWRPHF
ncbi:MAG: hypothetical protein LAP38_05965 [Acidobacteriia bacterium]|nr:hypothetical protein [Terriglobia bacterium]